MNTLVEFGGNVCIVDVVSVHNVLQDHIQQTCKWETDTDTFTRSVSMSTLNMKLNDCTVDTE